jgi:hypothetical protein
MGEAPPLATISARYSQRWWRGSKPTFSTAGFALANAWKK